MSKINSVKMFAYATSVVGIGEGIVCEYTYSVIHALKSND